jgi:glycosyltransferase involved in cell wall biosynthesis
VSPEDARNQASRRDLASPDPRIVLYTRFAGVRPDDVADIWGRVRSLAPDARLTVVGRGNQGEEEQLAGLPGVEVAGWLEPDAVQEVFRSVVLAIAPWVNTATNRSRHSAKILELMAAGLPVVAYDVGEMAVTLGDAGTLVQAGDAGRFAEGVAGLLRDAERRRQMGLLAQARVERLFNWDVLADVALAAYGA